MKKILIRLLIAMKTVLQLGPVQTFWYAVYQLGLRSGLFRRLSPVMPYPHLPDSLHSPYRLPEKNQVDAILRAQPGLVEALLDEANEICAGKARLFGGPPIPIELAVSGAARHWTYYEGRPQDAGVEDFKLIWEPARFHWAYPLGRAYLLTGDERYPAAFWQHLDIFTSANPPNQGPNWSSAQEVALRLVALLFAAQIFNRSPHTPPQRRSQLAGMIAAHARRIPLTLSYARAQNNNHLISEALGLLAASQALPNHPSARQWRKLGITNLDHAFRKQIRPDGTYVQHSTNYHRLMLQAALQATLLNAPLSRKARNRLESATCWLLAQTDPQSGRVPNLGANDSAHIFPMAWGGFQDFRPAGQAAARAFTGRAVFPPGPWDEESLWLGLPLEPLRTDHPTMPSSPAIYRMGDVDCWATLRAVRYRERPSHADQMHVDLWWQGENIALDAGTYRYTAAPPWENALADSLVHNTVTVNHQNQMLRAGKFLWLDWAQAKWLHPSQFEGESLAAQHNGYAHLGILHRRMVKQPTPDHWQITDDLLPARSRLLNFHQDDSYLFTLHWLLPDWPWNLDGNQLTLQHPSGERILISISAILPPSLHGPDKMISLARAGSALSGPPNVPPVLGWCSPSYAQKIPALSFSCTVITQLPLTFKSDWFLGKK